MLFKELGVLPSFGRIEPKPCELQREILSWGLAYMHTLDSLKIDADRIARSDEVRNMTDEDLLGGMSEHDLASERALARSRGQDPDAHLKEFAEQRRKRMLEAIEREGEPEEE